MFDVTDPSPTDAAGSRPPAGTGRSARPAPARSGDEAGRLRAVAAYGLDDASADAEFDRFAAAAAELLNLPIGLVTLVVEHEVVTKGRYGLDVGSVPRDVALCAHTVLDDAGLVVPDLTQDPRFSDNPAVRGEGGLRFYAGSPLISPTGGHRLGALCVVGREPRPGLEARETRLLATLASLVVDRMELRRAEKARCGAQVLFERTADAAPGAVVRAGGDGRITHWNAAAERMFGWSAGEAVGQRLEILVPEQLRAAHAADLACLTGAGDRALPDRIVELPALRRDGTTFPAQVALTCRYVGGAPVLSADIRDVTAQRAAEDRLRRLAHLAHFDPLTGLANRAKFNELVAEAATGDGTLALVLLDLDGFKHVNDTLGHGAGDVLLTEVAGRLSGTLQGRGALARLGGDEFAVLLPDSGLEAAEACARAAHACLEPQFRIGGRGFRVGASIGITVAPAGDAGGALANADLALYRAKAAGRGARCIFDATMRESYDRQRALEDEVRDAVLNGEFVLHYQPQVDLRVGTLVGAEALLRWRHPRRGLLPPAEFLGALEAGPLAGQVGDWAINEACRQAVVWREQGMDLRVSTNLFSEQLRAGALASTVRRALTRWRLPASALELEVTETIALRQSDGLLAPLHALHAEGVGIAFDDFGTGFSSLSTLRRRPLSRLKIDCGFVSGLGEAGGLGGRPDRGNAAIIDAVLALGRGLGLKVVAEGVETAAQAAFLAARGCDEGQGYLFGRPSPPELLQRSYLDTSRPTSGPDQRRAPGIAGWARTQLGELSFSRSRRRNRG